MPTAQFHKSNPGGFLSSKRPTCSMERGAYNPTFRCFGWTAPNMKRIQRWLFCFLSAGLAIHPLAARPAATPSQSTNLPRVFLLDGKHLLNVRNRVRGGDKSVLAALERLERESKQALAAGPFS